MIGHLAYFFQRRNTVLFIQAGAVLLLVSTALTWVTATGLGDTTAVSTLALSGGEMAPTVRAMGLVGVAGGVAATIARRWARGLIGAVLLGAGAISLLATVLAIADPAAAAAPSLGEVTGTTEQAAQYSLGFGLWIGLIGGIVLTLGSLGLLLFSPGWSDERASKKYDRGGSAGTAAPGRSQAAGTPQKADEFDLWDGLSDGEDPTAKEGEDPGEDGGTGSRRRR
ncbi:Trp biosynthesis-associated membrane protein [Nesterenkonia flava]|uniref:Trp biosynthesis-associated membrane protein n=1 Tax=Nesterenkonia flava TaxID=469799 RepID=A0ABU1FVH2_9MICC|nr:Trp biosynthesis-associated membrane protein [Nesterenkonia flava]MDR5712670.1 Trp biosynthesis-associated membrane protein [Nesterenkonia flava]